MEKIRKEQKAISAAEVTEGVNALLAVGDISCDKCGRRLNHGEKYCYSTKETTTEITKGYEEVRGTRYCKDCSLKEGFLKMVRNKKTGRTEAVKFVQSDEEVI